ncbi:SWR1 complex bromodomain subunit bdf1-like [Teratosphaeria destructans]|uniref:SWR1 complex bromodomain subunit bdf1-like n=1 Tax=Teratosphaeria destructans TaxID=418781 RepID=A0A9W7W2F6_9PEZI|nr:SWR1 complex bromodomain subunit bdf1-like [Teratosphaeria destructans]
MATEVSRDAPAPQDHALVNGHEDSITHDVPNHTANTESFEENAALPSKEPPFDLKATAPDPAGPTPTEDVSSGIQPVADFVPKDAPTLSHPTPPPEEPLITSQANLDTQMGDADAEVSTVENADADRAADNQASVVTENATATAAPNAESGLVRPREEDDDEADEERAVKRSKVDDEVARSQAMQPESALADPAAPLTNGDAGEHQATTEHSFQPLEPTAEAGQESTAEVEMTEPRPEAATEPVPEAAKTGSVILPAPPLQNDAEPPGADAAVQEPQSAVAPAPVEPSAGLAVEQDAKPAADVKPSVEAEPDPTSTAAAIPDAQYSTAPMTDFQKATLLEKMKNLKKTKHSAVFLKPVDPVALNIPTYPEIIKNPMDLELPQIQRRCSPITASAFNIEAYFKRTMETVPGPDAAPPARAPKRASPAVKNPARREPRAPAPAAQAPPAIGLDRRESIATGREPRTVKPTGPREIPYAKPKRKEHALELKFCEHILRQIESPTLAHYNVPFLTPVDLWR